MTNYMKYILPDCLFMLRSEENFISFNWSLFISLRVNLSIIFKCLFLIKEFKNQFFIILRLIIKFKFQKFIINTINILKFVKF
jgi:hypothetical protein